MSDGWLAKCVLMTVGGYPIFIAQDLRSHSPILVALDCLFGCLAVFVGWYGLRGRPE